MKARWQNFEDSVRDIAARIHARPCTPQHVHGYDIDGLIDIDRNTKWLLEITINHTLEKVRNDITKLSNARAAFFRQGILCRCMIVLEKEPTQSMVESGDADNIDILSRNSLASAFIDYERYRNARVESPFGSAVDPITGNQDTIKYVPVTYIDKNGSKEYQPLEIAERLVEGKNVLLLGEYGSGKSRCIAELFTIIAKEWGLTFQFPLAINLRECWGLERADELIRRHMSKLGLDELAPPAVRALNRGNILFLLDGFDEIGIQSWSADDARLRQLRAQALIAVKDAAKSSGTGILIAGREHYFSSDREMFSRVGTHKQDSLGVGNVIQPPD